MNIPSLCCTHHVGLEMCFEEYNYQDSLQAHLMEGMDQFRYIIHTIDLGTRLWRITTEFEGFIPQSLVLRSIVLG